MYKAGASFGFHVHTQHKNEYCTFLRINIYMILLATTFQSQDTFEEVLQFHTVHFQCDFQVI